MSTLPTRAIAHAYITEHGLQNILNRAVNACVHAKASDPIGFIIDHLKAVKEAATSNTMVVAVEKEEEATTVVPAVTSEFDEVLLKAAGMYGNCDLAKVEALLAQGADVEAVDKSEFGAGKTPLHIAAWRGHTAIVEALLAKGANVKAVNKDGATPLHEAAYHGHSAIVDALIAHGADVKAVTNDGRTSLHWAAYFGNSAIVDALLKAGADGTAKDKSVSYTHLTLPTILLV